MAKPLAIVETKSIVTIPANVQKMIVDVNVQGILNNILPSGITADSIIKPRDIVMSHEAARASIGAPMTPKALIIGLAYLTLANAYGQGKPETLAKDCKPFAVKALADSCQYFKAGAGGVTVEKLTTAIQSAVKAMLTMPKNEKAKVAEKPAIQGTSTRVDDVDENNVDEKTGRAKKHSLAFGHEAHELALRERDAAMINTPFMLQHEAQKLADEKAKNEDVSIARIIEALAVNRPEFALAQLQEAAAILGYHLRKIPAKKAA